MKLNKLLKNIDYELLSGSLDIDVSDITYNSKTATKNTIFVALIGIDKDGHDYIEDALNNGCNIFLVSKLINLKNKTVIKVKDTRKILPTLSATFYNFPADKLIKIGITGTKGKTTVSFMIKKMLELANYKVGLIGTNGTYFNDIVIEHKNTTPESLLIQKYMKMMVDNGIKYLVMEVSSQSLKVGRVSNIIFDYSIFTNLSIDHIGPREHPTYQDYVNSKAKLFSQTNIAIMNHDCREYNNIKKVATSKILTYGINDSDYTISNIKTSKTKTTFTLNNTAYQVYIPGKFNVYNASSAIIIAKLLHIKDDIIKKALKDITIPGRLEEVPTKENYKIIIDFAHNELSILSVLNTLKEYNKNIVTVVGCGGGRSRNIRESIGMAVGKLSNYTLITSDNPRNDNLDEINKDIARGVEKAGGKYKIIPDRIDAIKYALCNIKNKDLVLLLGKGHELYEEIKGVRHPFDERKIIKEILEDKYNE